MFLKKYIAIVILPMTLVLSSCFTQERSMVDKWQETLENSDNTESVDFISSIFNDQTYNDLLDIFAMSEEIANSISEDKGVTQQTVAKILKTGGYGADAAMEIAKNLADDFSTVTGIKQSDIMKFLLMEEMSPSVEGILQIPNDAIEKVKTSIDKIGVEETKEMIQKMKKNIDTTLDRSFEEIPEEDDQKSGDYEDIN